MPRIAESWVITSAVFLPLLSAMMLATSRPTTAPMERADWMMFLWACLSQYR